MDDAYRTQAKTELEPRMFEFVGYGRRWEDGGELVRTVEALPVGNGYLVKLTDQWSRPFPPLPGQPGTIVGVSYNQNVLGYGVGGGFRPASSSSTTTTFFVRAHSLHELREALFVERATS